MMTKILVAMAAIALVACSAQTPGANVEPRADNAVAGAWVVDTAKSLLEFTATQSGAAFTGKFGKFDAEIVLDPENLSAASIRVTVDMTSATTGDRQRDDALPSVDWFSAKAFPAATFHSSEIVSLGEGAYEARGALKIRDAEKPLVLPFTLSISGDRAVADGTISLVRTDFGVGQGEFSTDEWVGFNVGVRVHIEASR